MRRMQPIGGDHPMDRIMRQVVQYAGLNVDIPSVEQVAVVLHALADYTTWQQGVRFSGSDDTACNVGRFLHAYGDLLEGRYDL